MELELSPTDVLVLIWLLKSLVKSKENKRIFYLRRSVLFVLRDLPTHVRSTLIFQNHLGQVSPDF